MSSRRRAREFALLALFQADLEQGEVTNALQAVWAAQIDGLLEGRPAEADEIDYARRIAVGVEGRRAEIDALIEKASTNWRVVRMPTVDRNILRLASYELLACQDVPPNVSINEAVELAKRYGDSQSKAFVNGILDRIASETGRGGRASRAATTS